MKILPFYTSTGQRDAERVNAHDALLCPVHKILPFQIQRDHVANTYLTSLNLVDCNGVSTDILERIFSGFDVLTGWVNAGFETFDESGVSILTAVESGSARAFCYSNTVSLLTGESVKINYNLTMNSGQIPKFYLGTSAGAFHSTGVSMSTGAQSMYLQATASGGGFTRLLVNVTTNSSFKLTGTIISRNNADVDEFATYDFITYNGTPLSTRLPYGVYYLQASDGVTTWYSEWFSVQDIQPNLLTGWASETYDTWTVVGLTVASAITTGGGGGNTNTFSVRTGEKIVLTLDYKTVANSAPKARIQTATTVISNEVTLVSGLREYTFTVTASSAAAMLTIYSTSSSSWQGDDIRLMRVAGAYMFLKYTNSRDIDTGKNAIYYANGFTQQVYLDTYLNNPDHEVIETGEEKNGVFVPEKLVDRLIYNIISYCSWSLFRALRLLPMHSTIEIYDEVGNRYAPSAGNVRVQMDKTAFGMGTLRIDFNEDGDVWTNNMDNII